MTLSALCLHWKLPPWFLTPALTSTANNSWLLNKPASDVSSHIDFHLFIIIIAGVRIQSWLVCVHRCAGVTPHVPTSIFTGKLEEWWRSACVTMNHSVAHETPHRQSWQTIRDERHAVGWPRGPAMKTLVGCVTYAAARWITNQRVEHLMPLLKIRLGGYEVRCQMSFPSFDPLRVGVGPSLVQLLKDLFTWAVYKH